MPTRSIPSPKAPRFARGGLLALVLCAGGSATVAQTASPGALAVRGVQLGQECEASLSQIQRAANEDGLRVSVNNGEKACARNREGQFPDVIMARILRNAEGQTTLKDVITVQFDAESGRVRDVQSTTVWFNVQRVQLPLAADVSAQVLARYGTPTLSGHWRDSRGSVNAFMFAEGVTPTTSSILDQESIFHRLVEQHPVRRVTAEVSEGKNNSNTQTVMLQIVGTDTPAQESAPAKVKL